MRFWLRWAIVTLPLVCCLSLCARSYWIEDILVREGSFNQFELLAYRGSFGVIFMRLDHWGLAGGIWAHQATAAANVVGHVTEQRIFGFGYESTYGPTPWRATVIEVPAWFLTMLLAVPPFWLYRRQRKRRKTGFPVEPVAANSKESTPAQMD
jgi:hypothetical protein